MHGSEYGEDRFEKEKEHLVIESLLKQEFSTDRTYVIGELGEALKDVPEK